jgi:methanogenic corrinoid protein MtbC1
MVNFDNINFYRAVNEVIYKLGMEEAITKIFFNFFVRIGTYWQIGSIFPAQEHYVSNILRQKIIAEIDKLGIVHSRQETILFYLPDNEMHEISLLFYAYLAQKMGYRVIYLGQFVPLQDLNKIQDQVRIDYVFTAFINSITKDDLEKYLETVKEFFHDQKVFVTGRQIQSHNPKLPRNVKIVKDYHEFEKFLR